MEKKEFMQMLEWALGELWASNHMRNSESESAMVDIWHGIQRYNNAQGRPFEACECDECWESR